MNKNYIVVAGVVLLLLLAGYFIFRDGGMNGSNNNGLATTTPSPSPIGPTPTPSPVSTVPAIPTVETNNTATPSSSSVVVTGTVVPNGAPTTYWYEYGTTPNLGSKTTVQSIGSGYVKIGTPGYITRLSANTTYFYKLVAQNRLGTASGATYSFPTNSNPAPTGGIPTATTNSAIVVARTSATLNGQVNPKDATTNYWFEYGTDTNFGNITAFQAAGNGNAVVSVSANISQLNPLTKYYYRINAQNQFGTVNGSTSNFTTLGPSAPGVPTVDTTNATSISTSTVTMNGRLTPNGVQTTYWFEYSENSLLGSIVGNVTASQTLSGDSNSTNVSISEDGLNRNKKYFYRLVARNQYGTVEGDMVSFTTSR